ncbi:MAG: cobalamin-binding protein, partial [bacterium]|nr:cobalamin-binding protein [bacterium]
EIQPDIVALSTLMTSTLDKMHLIVDSIRDKFPDDPPKIMIGGAPVSARYAEEINADLYSKNAQSAVIDARLLLGI